MELASNPDYFVFGDVPGWFARRASEIGARRLRHGNTTGKSPKTCPALRTKTNRWPRRANQIHNSRHPVSPERRWPSSQTTGRERWTRQHARRTGCSVRWSRLGPTPRCWRQVGGSESFQWRWWQESRSPGRSRI